MLPSAPRVAVVIPLFNHERYIATAIESVMHQTRLPDRLVVVDDGSVDGSAAAVTRVFERSFPFPVELRRQGNQGSARTLNRAIAGLDEDIIAILNSDDAWHPKRLESMLPCLSTDRPTIAFSGVEFFGDESEADLAAHPQMVVRLLSVARELPTLGFALLLGNFAISTGNLLFSKRLFEAVGGFDESLAIIHDWQFLLQSTRFVEPTLIPRFLYRYRIHGSNTYRVNPEPTGSDVVRMHQSFFAWASQQANNPLAPIPQHFPRFYPFFLPIWLRFVSQRGGNVPRLLARLAGSLRDSPSARSAAIERTAVARTYALLKAPRKEADVTQFAALLEECASRWNAIAGTYPRAEPRLGRPVEAAARFEWAGASVTVTTSDPVLLHDLADFTGLVAIPDQIPLGRAGLNALGTHDVYVHDQHRRYPCPEDRLIWLALTVGEFLARDGAALLLHAASIRFDSGAVLLMGEPLTGKSTLAFEALSCGLGVLGDDQVRLQAATSRVQALPRPVKLRVPIDAPLPAGIPSGRKPLRGHLENEPTLMLRRAGLCVSPDGWHSTSLVVHLSRRRDCQCAIERIEDPELMREFLTAQLRGALADHPDPFETVARGLLGIPHYRLSVGVGKAAEALALIAATLRDRLGT